MGRRIKIFNKLHELLIRITRNKSHKEYNAEIDSIIGELIGYIGIREQFDATDVKELIRVGKMKEAVNKIKTYMALPVSFLIVNTNTEDAAAADVDIPPDLPTYGSKALINFPINIFTYRGYNLNPDRTIAVLSHEFCHILLHSVGYKDKQDERHTDIASMIVGFADYVEAGRVTVENVYNGTRTHTLGYLTDTEIKFASSRIKEILRAKRSIKNSLLEKLSRYIYKPSFSAQIQRFYELLQLLDANKNVQADASDISMLISAHKPGFIEDVLDGDSNLDYQKELNRIIEKVKNITNYSMGNMDIIFNIEKSLANNTLIPSVANDKYNYVTSILEKYITQSH